VEWLGFLGGRSWGSVDRGAVRHRSLRVFLAFLLEKHVDTRGRCERSVNWTILVCNRITGNSLLGSERSSRIMTTIEIITNNLILICMLVTFRLRSPGKSRRMGEEKYGSAEETGAEANTRRDHEALMLDQERPFSNSPTSNSRPRDVTISLAHKRRRHLRAAKHPLSNPYSAVPRSHYTVTFQPLQYKSTISRLMPLI
jgi:hypothetical protein